MLRIVNYPHPALRYEARPVMRIDDALRAQVRQMFDLMYEARGVGLAATQVAIPRRFFILNLKADRAQPELEQVFINPTILKRHGQIEDEEGCLSFPGLYGEVRRARKIRLQAYTLGGEPIEVDVDDLFSRAAQHEIDHLDGRLFIDWLDPGDRATLAPKIREMEIEYHRDQAAGSIPSDDELKRELDELARD